MSAREQDVPVYRCVHEPVCIATGLGNTARGPESAGFMLLREAKVGADSEVMQARPSLDMHSPALFK